MPPNPKSKFTSPFENAPIGVKTKQEPKHFQESYYIDIQSVLDKFNQARSESSPSQEKREDGDHMDESTKMFIERLERDSREREERYHKDAQEREERYRQEIIEQDRRFRLEAKEREERFEKLILRISSDITETKNSLKEDIKDVKDSVSRAEDKISSSTKHIQTLVTTNIWGLIATIVAIAALAVTIFFSLNGK